MRGKHHTENFFIQTLRITPACAGKTRTKGGINHDLQDHPRVCGENSDTVQSALTPEGSPPRVRGKHNIRIVVVFCKRITPACAGKTNNINSFKLQNQDHPRVCGENFSNPALVHAGVGSPPRVRGKQRHRQKFTYCVRITPACAGKTDGGG